MHLLHAPVEATTLRSAPAAEAPDARPVLDTIRARGVLRVGYVDDGLPFSFFNAKGDLVGLDIDLAHRLASELHVGLEFRPIDRAKIAEHLSAGYCDFVTGGVAVTTLRAGTMLFSDAYMDETLAFVVPDAARERFSTWASIGEMRGLTLAVPNVAYYIDLLKRRLPHAEIRIVTTAEDLFAQWDPTLDAFALPAERGSAWTLLYPKFTVVVPEPGIIKVPVAFPLARHDQAFATFMNTWIDLKRKDGTLQQLYDYWVLGRNAVRPTPRWSIMRNVLQWVE